MPAPDLFDSNLPRLFDRLAQGGQMLNPNRQFLALLQDSTVKFSVFRSIETGLDRADKFPSGVNLAGQFA